MNLKYLKKKIKDESYKNVNPSKNEDIDATYQTEVAQAKIYKMYLRGEAYIPYQDLARYERSYEKVYGLNEDIDATYKWYQIKAMKGE